MIATRQNAGKSAMALLDRRARRLRERAGGDHFVTLSIVASGRVNDFRLSQVADHGGDGIAITNAARVIARNMALPPRRYCYPEAACSGYSE